MLTKKQNRGWMRATIFLTSERTGIVSDPTTYANRKKRIIQALPALSPQLVSDIQGLLQMADAIHAAFESNETKGLFTPATGKALNTPSVSKEETAERKSTVRTRRKKQHREKLLPEQIDELRLQLLKADNQGDANHVKRTEKAVAKAYGRKRLSGLRAHSTGAWKGAFIARMLERAQTRSERTAVLKELCEAYGEDRETILQASKIPAPKYNT